MLPKLTLLNCKDWAIKPSKNDPSFRIGSNRYYLRYKAFNWIVAVQY